MRRNTDVKYMKRALFDTATPQRSSEIQLGRIVN